MNFGPQDEEMRKWVDSICILSGVVETLLVEKGYNVELYVLGDSDPSKSEFGGD